MNVIANLAVARELNSFLLAKGGPAIPGLETLDAPRLQKLQRGMQEFLDAYDSYDHAESDLGKFVGESALESMREMTRLLSHANVGGPAKGARRMGMCGRSAAPPPPVSPEQPPLVSPERGGSGNVTMGALSAGGGNNATFNPLAASFVSASSVVSNLRSSPTEGFNPLAALNQAFGLAGTSTATGDAPPSGVSSLSGVDANLEALQGAGGGGGYFEDRLFALMIQIVADMQKQVEERLKKLQEKADAAEKDKGKKKGGKGGFLGGVIKGVIGVAAPLVGTAIGGPIGGMVGGMVGKAVAGSGGGGGSGGGKSGGEAGGSESRNIEFEKIKFDMQKLSQMQQALSNVLNTMDELAKSAIRSIKGG